MNSTITAFARQAIKDNLERCSEGERSVFMRMYSPKNLDLSISAAVDAMPDDKLDWALTQTENTLRKRDAKSAPREATDAGE